MKNFSYLLNYFADIPGRVYRQKARQDFLISRHFEKDEKHYYKRQESMNIQEQIDLSKIYDDIIETKIEIMSSRRNYEIEQ